MSSQPTTSTSQYEKALAEIIEMQTADEPMDLGRLEQLSAQIEAFEQSMWTDAMFESFDAIQPDV